MLNGTLQLGDIRNVEKLCDRIATQALGARVGRVSTSEFTTSAMHANTISEHEREELLSFLITEAWILWRRYDPSKGAKFSTFAIPQLRLRVLDWRRRKTGYRSGRSEGRKQQPGEWGVLSTGDLDDPELERALASGRRDDPADRYADLDGLLAAGGREARGLVDA